MGRYKVDAASAFHFLVTEYHFMLVDESSQLVRYESSETYVVVYLVPRSGEVGVRVGLLRLDPGRDDGYSIQEIMRAEGVPEQGRSPDLYAMDSDALPARLRRLADLVRTYGRRALVGESAFYLALSDRRIEETKAYTDLRKAEEWARREIAIAWSRGDYGRAARLYAWLDPNTLTREERKRRSVARSKESARNAGDRVGENLGGSAPRCR